MQNKAQNLFFSEDFIKRDAVLLIVILSGIFGLFVGLAFSTWQGIVESSQVVAGLVKYPRENSAYLNQVKIWTVLHQLGAVALLLGLTEKTISIVVSGLMGMLSFQALALFVFALSGNILFSILIPFFMQFTQVAAFGINYPIQLVGFSHTAGVMGLSFSVLVIALFSLKRYKAGGLLLGILPAVHPSLGLFLCFVLLGAFLWDFKNLRQHLIVSLKYFMLGCLFTGTSLAIHLLFTYDVPKISSDIAGKYINIVIRYWDVHRKPVNFLSINFYLAVLSPTLSMALLKFGRKNIPEHFLFPLRVFAISGIVGALACVTTHMSPDQLDWRLAGFMPTRLLNLNVMTLFPLFVGLMAFYKDDDFLQTSLFFLIAILTIILGLHPLYWGRLMAFVLTLCAVILVSKMALDSYPSWFRFKHDLPMAGTLFVLFIIMILGGMQACSTWNMYKNNFLNWENDRMLSRIHEGDNLLLVGPGILGFVQMYTRRPVLLVHFLAISYVPEAGPMVDDILKEVYGIDLFNPSKKAKELRDIPVEEVKVLWESRTLEQWHAIRGKYAVTDILTYANWNLQLPIASPPEWKTFIPGDGTVKERYILFHIP